MEKKLNISENLDFSEADLTEADKVVEEIANLLPNETNDMIYGKIESYDGPIESYTRKGFSLSLKEISDEKIDIQDKLGSTGEESKRFEFYLYTPVYDSYKYRVFFMEYNISHYPVKLVLERSIAESILESSYSYTITCKSRADLEDKLIKILESKRVISIMQSIIKIYQANKDTNYTKADDES